MDLNLITNTREDCSEYVVDVDVTSFLIQLVAPLKYTYTYSKSRVLLKVKVSFLTFSGFFTVPACYPFSASTPDLNTSKAVVTFIPRGVICVLSSLYGPAPTSETALTLT